MTRTPSPAVAVADQPGDEIPMPRRRRRWVAWLVVSFLAVGFLAGGSWWATHPSPFYAGGVTNTSTAQAHVGEPITFGTFPFPDHPLTLRSVQVVVVGDSADATVAVVLCLPRSSYTGIARNQTVRELCQRELPLSGARMLPGGHGLVPELIVQITPHRAGTVRVQGVRIDYRDGLRRGSQYLNSTLVVTTAD